ncbi:hypothetical protein [Rhizorhabdus argentea]
MRDAIGANDDVGIHAFHQHVQAFAQIFRSKVGQAGSILSQLQQFLRV